jgi:hypothetical protein
VFFQPGALVPAVVVTPGNTLQWRGFGAALINATAPTIPIVSVDAAGIFALFAFANNAASGIGTDIVSGAGNFQLVIDDTVPIQATYLPGSTSVTRSGLAASAFPSEGATGARPTGFAVTTGQTFFDTTLGIPVWWNGATWVNSAGVPS